MIKGFFVIFFLGIFSIQTQADPSCKELKELWYTKYQKDFNIAGNANIFNCRGGESKLALALYDLQSNEYKPDQAGYKPDFYKFLMSRVTRIVYDTNCEKGWIAFTVDKTITLCKDFYSDTRVDRASSLVHEARHTQEDDPNHVTCEGGKFKGPSGCDQNFYNGQWQGSGFNADIHFLSWTLNSETKTELKRSVIQSDINAMVPDRFNNITGEEIRSWRK